MDYKQKYLKYKNKYFNLSNSINSNNLFGGGLPTSSASPSALSASPSALSASPSALSASPSALSASPSALSASPSALSASSSASASTAPVSVPTASLVSRTIPREEILEGKKLEKARNLTLDIGQIFYSIGRYKQKRGLSVDEINFCENLGNMMREMRINYNSVSFLNKLRRILVRNKEYFLVNELFVKNRWIEKLDEILN
jgi:hypothetical protein